MACRATDDNLGRAVNFPALWEEAKKVGFECAKEELLDALYTLPREYGALIKFLSAGEGIHPVEFDRVRNTMDWPEFFLTGGFYIKVLHEGKVHYHRRFEPLRQQKRCDQREEKGAQGHTVGGCNFLSTSVKLLPS